MQFYFSAAKTSHAPPPSKDLNQQWLVGERIGRVNFESSWVNESKPDNDKCFSLIISESRHCETQ